MRPMPPTSAGCAHRRGVNRRAAPDPTVIRMPQSETAAIAAGSTCFIDDGAPAIGKMSLARGSGLFTLEKVSAEHFATGEFSCWGSITFECA